HFSEMKDQQMRDWFASDEDRFPRYSLTVGDIFLDFSRQRINEKTLSLLLELAHAAKLSGKIADLFNGALINITEKRPALHTALRDQNHSPLKVNGINVAALIAETQEKMRHFVQKIHSQEWKGITGKPLSHVVNIGIGGSYRGPQMSIQA